ncbi:hypothetical protein [Indioceanicola profundi]|uniref:hypothetical protein n=1 Tax=Indioceanicola profundi TaxID=2220096 RepID=UPI000E6AA31F|nr:hypothetical protein [Indioceanicola profundi]
MGVVAKTLFGGTSTAKTTTTNEPWKAQSPYLTDAFGSAQDIYNSQKGTPFYQGPLHAGLNGVQTGAIGQVQNWTNGTGGQLAQGAANAALSGMGNAQTFGANAANFAQGNTGVQNPVAPGMTGTLNDYAQTALQGASGVQSGLNGVLSGAMADPTQANIQAAQAYANNPAMDGMIDAASRDVTRALGQEVLGLNSQATAGGNLNSSRAGAAEAVATARAGDRIADISSTMRGNAYQSGLGLAESARTSNQGVALSALGQQAAQANAGLGALSFLENQRQFDTGTALQGNAQLGQSASLGYQGAGVAQNLQMGNLDALFGAGGLMQQDTQGRYDADYLRWQGEDTRANDLLNRYYGIIGADKWGGTMVSTQPVQKQGLLQQGLGVASIAAGIGGQGGFGLWGNK